MTRGIADCSRALWALALLAAPTAIDAACVGDCNENGVLSTADVVTGVRVALAEETAVCAPLSEDDDAVTIDDLVRAADSLRQGCSLPPDLRRLVGVYDTELRYTGQGRPPDGVTVDALGIIGPATEDTAYASFYIDLYSFMQFAVFPASNGAVSLEGNRIVGGDVAFLASGSATAQSTAEGRAVNAMIDSDDYLGDVHIAGELRRPFTGTPDELAGSYDFTFSTTLFGRAEQSSAALDVALTSSGIGTCGATIEESDSRTDGSIVAGYCYVSPAGRFYFDSTYTNPDLPMPPFFQTSENFVMLGELSADAQGSGQFIVGLFPGPFVIGSWVSEKHPNWP